MFGTASGLGSALGVVYRYDCPDGSYVYRDQYGEALWNKQQGQQTNIQVIQQSAQSLWEGWFKPVVNAQQTTYNYNSTTGFSEKRPQTTREALQSDVDAWLKDVV